MSGDSIWSVVAVVGVLILLLAGWQFAAVEGASATAHTDTTTVASGESYELESSGVNHTVTSITTSGGTTLDAGDDYRVAQYSGTIEWTDSAPDGTEVTIEYRTATQDAQTAALTEQLSLFKIVIGLAFFGVCASVALGQIGRWL